MKSGSKQFLKVVIRIGVTGVLLVWVFSRFDLQQLGTRIKTARWEFLVIIWALALIAFWIRVIKLGVILRKQDCHINISTLFGASAVTSLYAMIMPGILSTSVKWYILTKNTGKGTNVLSGMVYNQLTEIVVIVVLGLGGLTLVNISGRWKFALLCLILLTAVIVCSAIVLSRRTGPKLSRYLTYLLKPMPGSVYERTAKFFNQISIFQKVPWRFHLNIAFITICSNLFSVIIYILAAKAAEINVPTAIFVWQYPLIYILAKFPISVANLGVREFTLVETLAHYGVAAPQAVLMSMIIFSCAILMAIIGAVCQVWTSLAKKHP